MDDYEGDTSPEMLAQNIDLLVVGEILDDDNPWRFAIDEYIYWHESPEGGHYWMSLWDQQRAVTQQDVDLLIVYCHILPFLGTVEEKDIV